MYVYIYIYIYVYIHGTTLDYTVLHYTALYYREPPATADLFVGGFSLRGGECQTRRDFGRDKILIK